MAAKKQGNFHIAARGAKAGQVVRCPAKNACTLKGDNPHFETQEEGNKWIQEQAAKENDTFAVAKKKAGKRSPRSEALQKPGESVRDYERRMARSLKLENGRSIAMAGGLKSPDSVLLPEEVNRGQVVDKYTSGLEYSFTEDGAFNSFGDGYETIDATPSELDEDELTRSVYNKLMVNSVSDSYKKSRLSAAEERAFANLKGKLREHGVLDINNWEAVAHNDYYSETLSHYEFNGDGLARAMNEFKDEAKLYREQNH